MLPSDPNWLSADSALWAAILAGLSVLVTGTGVWVAYKALSWAKKAAEEAGKQANAAMDAAESSRKAAEAAQRQIEVLEKQIALSEPQPVVNLRMGVDIHGNRAVFIENLGETLAFDVQVSDFFISIDHIKNRRSAVLFLRETVLKSGTERMLTVASTTENVLDMSVHPGTLNDFLAVWEQKRPVNTFMPVRRLTKLMPIEVTYRNARGRAFETKFAFGEKQGNVEIFPEVSLITQKDPPPA